MIAKSHQKDISDFFFGGIWCFCNLVATGGAMRRWGCRGRELITRAKSLRARAKHA